MGLIARTLGGLLPARKIAVGASVPTWQHGTPQQQRENYYRYSLEGYGGNEIVYACVEELSTSAAEPEIAAYRGEGKTRERVERHPALDVLGRPNPFCDRFTFWATIIMHLSIAGNAYVEKVRSGAGKVVELWPLRPDRMWVLPDQQAYIRGWEYRLAEQTHYLDARDVLHFRNRNPLDDYYGLPPLAVAARRVDTDNYMREFTGAFFRNAGVPAGLLTVKREVDATDRRIIQDRFRGELAGPSNWHSLLVLDATEASYTPMGLPLGERGLVLPELDEIHEARIPMAFGVPLELIGARLGMIHGNRSTMKEARASFWDETLAPLYQQLSEVLNLALLPEYPDLTCFEFDLGTVAALREDEDQKHTRIREDVKAGLLSIQEGRQELGREPEFEAGAILLLPDNLSPLPAEQLDNPPVPEPDPKAALPPPAPSRNGNGRAREEDLQEVRR